MSLRVFVNDERLRGQMSVAGLHLHWFCSTDSSWQFSSTNPDDDVPPGDTIVWGKILLVMRMGVNLL